MSEVVSLHPDWGEIDLRADRAAGPLLNPAGFLEMARIGTTPIARRTYQAICRHWRTCKDLPGLSDAARQAECLRRALAEVGIRLVFPDSPEEP